SATRASRRSPLTLPHSCRPPLCPSTTLFRSYSHGMVMPAVEGPVHELHLRDLMIDEKLQFSLHKPDVARRPVFHRSRGPAGEVRPEEHTSERQSRFELVCRLLREEHDDQRGC